MFTHKIIVLLEKYNKLLFVKINTVHNKSVYVKLLLFLQLDEDYPESDSQFGVWPPGAKQSLRLLYRILL